METNKEQSLLTMREYTNDDEYTFTNTTYNCSDERYEQSNVKRPTKANGGGARYKYC